MWFKQCLKPCLKQGVFKTCQLCLSQQTSLYFFKTNNLNISEDRAFCIGFYMRFWELKNWATKYFWYSGNFIRLFQHLLNWSFESKFSLKFSWIKCQILHNYKSRRKKFYLKVVLESLSQFSGLATKAFSTYFSVFDFKKTCAFSNCSQNYCGGLVFWIV